MMFGGTREEALSGPMLSMLDAGYTQSVRMMTDTLGLHPDDVRIETTLEVAVATAPIESPIGTIQPGQVGGQRCFWDGYVGEEKVARVGVTWLMGEQNLDPAWSFGEQGERVEFEVRGNPDTYIAITSWHPTSIEEGLKRNPGLIATAAHCVNAIPYVCAAPTGVCTSVDLPMVAGAPIRDYSDRNEHPTEFVRRRALRGCPRAGSSGAAGLRTQVLGPVSV